MERKATQERHVYIYYRYEDGQWLLDFNSTSTKESLYIGAGKNYKLYMQIYSCSVIYNVVQQNIQVNMPYKKKIVLYISPCIKVMIKKVKNFF